MLKVLVKKELKRVFSDRRLVFSAFILPAMSIFILYSLMGNMMTNMFEDTQEHTSVVKIYNAPNSFRVYYEQSTQKSAMRTVFSDGDYKGSFDGVKSGDIDLVVRFSNGFDEEVIAYESGNTLPEVQTYYNPVESYSNKARRDFKYDLLEAYEDQLLTERFGHMNYATAFAVDTMDETSAIVDEAKATGAGLSMILPMLIAILLFAGAMGIGLDTIAGEKERGTMATLLMAPIPRETIALGKVIGLAIVAIISATCSFLAIIASLPSSSEMIAQGMDISISDLAFSPLQYVQLLVVMLTLVGIYVGLICITSVRAKSVKEAGTYVSPIYMLVMFASFSTMFTTGNPKLYQFAIPILGNVLALKRLLTFELLMSEFLLTSGVSIVITAILIYGITKSFNNEKVMLNA